MTGKGNCRPVMCLETGDIYESMSLCAKHFELSGAAAIQNAIRMGNRAKGFHFQYLDQIEGHEKMTPNIISLPGAAEDKNFVKGRVRIMAVHRDTRFPTLVRCGFLWQDSHGVYNNAFEISSPLWPVEGDEAKGDGAVGRPRR
eukprot:g71790.t1